MPCTDPTLTSRSARPVPPTPVLAVKVSNPVVVIFDWVSAAGVKSAIAPSAVRVTGPEVELMASMVIVPAPVVVIATAPLVVVTWSICTSSVSTWV